MEKSEEETLEVSFSSRKRKGMYIYQKEVKKQNMRKQAQNSAHLASPMCFKHTLGIQASLQLADITDI